MSEVKRKLFKSVVPFIKYVFENGKEAIFRNHIFATSVPSEIAQLQNEVDQGHPHIRVDPDNEFLTEEMENPVLALRNKIEAEVRAELELKYGKPVPANPTLVPAQNFRPTPSTEIGAEHPANEAPRIGDITSTQAPVIEEVKDAKVEESNTSASDALKARLASLRN